MRERERENDNVRMREEDKIDKLVQIEIIRKRKTGGRTERLLSRGTQSKYL